MNTLAVSVPQYGDRINNSNKAELESVDRKQGKEWQSTECYTRGQMLIACTFQDDVVVMGQSELMTAYSYVQKSKEPLLVRNENVLNSENCETVKHFKETKMKKKTRQLED